MSEVVNLNKVRKDRERTEKKAEADLNARKFGRTKAERMAEAAREAQAKGRLDQLKFEDE
ncbi:protein of unknown function [Octadecabacter temperatus]|uniref:Uncharacterized protein n=1 Tax=Octadecabacter temperatus TaxID=1458307 RepID=A0A0K0Y5V4_9RHOB|nr:DUF4169 family protein [Octadecabacter temperatus]AKS46305.1 hypothetical protein OSB_17600 [Octadecabacter temperatus]SIO11602.1 protein of unknown function [Octadecabacter temperatus]